MNTPERMIAFTALGLSIIGLVVGLFALVQK